MMDYNVFMNLVTRSTGGGIEQSIIDAIKADGGEVYSESCLREAAEFLDTFSSVLVPAGKAGSIYFGKSESPYFDEAAFSRPDIDATSGSVVFDANGNFVELGENVPDWSFPLGGGCPRILMRPQAERVASINLTSGWAQAQIQSLTFSENIYGSYPIYRIEPNNVSAPHSISRAFFKDPTAGAVTYQLEVYLKADGYTTASINANTSGGNTVNGVSSVSADINITTGVVTGTFATSDIMVNELLANGYRRLVFRVVYAGASNQVLGFAIFPNVRTTFIGDGGAVLVGAQIQETKGLISPILASPTSLSYFRSANSFTFTDLVTKGVFNVSSWSVYMEIENISVSPFAAFLQFRGTGLDLYFRALNNTTFSFWNQDANESMGIASVTSVRDNHKFVATYNNGLLNIYLNGTKVVTDYAYIFNVNAIDVMPSFSGGEYYFDVLGLATSPIAVSEAEAIKATS